MEENRDLVFQEVLNKATPEILEFGISEKVSPNEKRLVTEADLSNEAVQDLISNRQQREKFTKQIIIIMCSEIAFIAFLILGVFIVSCINALSPAISFNFPPLFLTLSLILVYVYLYKFTNDFPSVRICCKQIKLKKHELSLDKTAKVVLTIIFIIFLNIFAREHHTIYYKPIILTDNVIHMILYTALAVFAKTTFLAGYIIKGLYEALNKSNKSKNKKFEA